LNSGLLEDTVLRVMPLFGYKHSVFYFSNTIYELIILFYLSLRKQKGLIDWSDF